MENDPSAMATAMCELSEPAQVALNIAIEADAAEFVLRRGIRPDFIASLQRLTDVFEPEKITVELIPGDEDDNPELFTLGFKVKCDLDHKSFTTKCDYFFESYRSSKPPIYFLMSVLRDL